MRRFELIEGSSKKFWEIALEDTGFTVRWGRIGTDGQTQQKSFPSADKARSEHDKLIAEKTKKGYAEAGTSADPDPVAAPTPAPAPALVKKAKAAAAPAPEAPAPAAVAPAAPAPTAPPPVPDGAIFWSDSLLRRVFPRRGGVTVPVRPLPSVQKLWAQVRENFRERTGGEVPPMTTTTDTALVQPTQAVFERMAQSEPSLGTPEEDAILITLLQFRMSYDHEPRFEPVIDLLFALGGPAHVTQAALLSLDMYLKGEEGVRLWVFRGWTQDAHHQHYNLLQNDHLRGLPRLRALLATQTDEAQYRAARDAAAPLRTTSLDTLSACTFLFPTELDWARAEAERFVHQPDSHMLLAGLSEPGPLEQLLPHLNLWKLTSDTGRALLPSLLDGLGAHALVLLRTLYLRRTSSESQRDLAELISSISTDEALNFLLDQPDKEVVPFVLEAMVRSPSRALRLLPPRAVSRNKESELARSMLTGLLRRNPEAVQAALPGLSEEAREVITRLQSQFGPDVPDATPEQLPPVLARPPWRSGQQAEAPPVLKNVVPPPLPDTLVWAEGEREEWARRKGWEYQPYGHTPHEKGLLSGQDEMTLTHGVVDTRFFAYAPEPLALKTLNKLKPTPYEMDWLPPIIVKLGVAVLPVLLPYVDAQGSAAQHLLAPFAHTSLAPQMADAFHHTKKARAAAREWLLRHPAHAAAGLLVPALGKPGKARDAAGAALRLLATSGHEATVLDVAGRATPAPQVLDGVKRLLAFSPLDLYPAKLPKLPDSLVIESLPRPLLRDRSAKLPAEAVRELATMLAFSTLEEPYAGLAQVKAACDPVSLARFAWALFDTWLVSGASSKEAWAFLALGLLGDDESARRLAPLIRQWPGEAAHARAVMGLDVLRAIGTDITLIYLNGIAEKVKFKGLQQQAQERIEQIAEARGLTREELADRLVPDLGLDDAGSLTLDFGARTFHVGFDEQLKPFVKDASGARLKDLPKPNQKDEADKAEAAAEQWKALKKDAKTAAALQILRLELAMCARRRWSPEVFRRFFVDHPLLIHVVRRLVWGTWSPEGTLTATFRVAEDRTFADPEENTWTLPEDALVGLPHALELDTKTAGAWGQVLADYQLLQPFPQLGRPTFAITPAERTATKLERVKGLKLPTGKVLGLETRGWRRGPPEDGGVVNWMEKPLGGELVAWLELDPGLYTGMLSESPEQKLGDVTLRTTSTASWSREGARPLGEMDPIVFSELVRDLEDLRPA